MSSLPRFIIDHTPLSHRDVAGDSIEISGDEFNHLSRSNRLTVGDELEILIRPQGSVFKATLKGFSRSCATVTLASEVFLIPLPKVHLMCGVIEDRLTDQIIDQSVQAGVTSIRFFSAVRSQRAPKLERLNRWTRLADSALKQSGFHDFKGVALSPSLESALQTLHRSAVPGPDEQRFLFCPPGAWGETLNILSLLPRNSIGEHPFEAGDSASSSSRESSLQPAIENAESYLIVGPEGGFTDKEHETAGHLGYRRASVGLKTFRTETAAVLVCAFFLLRA